jgi:hypothetical protein
MKLKRLGFLAAIIAAFAAGSRTGVKYAKDHYVSKDRKFIEGKVADDRTRPDN